MSDQLDVVSTIKEILSQKAVQISKKFAESLRRLGADTASRGIFYSSLHKKAALEAYEDACQEAYGSLLEVLDTALSSLSLSQRKDVSAGLVGLTKEWLHSCFQGFGTAVKGHIAVIGPSQVDLPNVSGFEQAAIAHVQLQTQLFKEKEMAELQSASYVNHTRLDELRSIPATKFDLTRLIRLCEELNLCYQNECYQAVAMLVRAIMDHVPPIFEYENFNEIANNYSGSGKSFREHMKLFSEARKIADGHLHLKIRAKESLPTSHQVRFQPSLDALLEEIVRILK